MKYLLLLSLVLSNFSAFTQELPEKQTKSEKYLATYLHIQDNFSGSNIYISDLPLLWTHKLISFGDISFAFTLKKNRISHEFELMPFHFYYGEKQVYFGYMYVNSNLLYFKTFAKYHFNYFLFKTEKKWSPFLGCSLGLSVENANAFPLIAVAFHTTNTLYTIPFEFEGGSTIKINDNLFWTIKIPVIFNKLYIKHTKVDNPALPVKLRTNTFYQGILLPRTFHLQFGITYKFNKK